MGSNPVAPTTKAHHSMGFLFTRTPRLIVVKQAKLLRGWNIGHVARLLLGLCFGGRFFGIDRLPGGEVAAEIAHIGRRVAKMHLSTIGTAPELNVRRLGGVFQQNSIQPFCRVKPFLNLALL